MVPLERFVPKDQGEKKGQKPRESSFLLSQMDVQRQQELKDMLAKFRENYRKRRQETIEEAKERASRKVEVSSFESGESSPERKEKKERKERKELLAVQEYNRIWDFQYNKEAYWRKESGWKHRYLTEEDSTDGIKLNEKMSIEQFVRDRQIEELQRLRDGLMVERLDRSLDILYPNLSLPEAGEQEREDKLQAVIATSRAYLQQHREQFDAYMAAGTEDRSKMKPSLLEAFRLQVFPDLDFSNQQVVTETSNLFDQLMADYEDMQNAIFQLDALNDKMVMLLADPNIDEEKWFSELAKESEKELEKIKADEKMAQEQGQYLDASGYVTNYGSLNFDYSKPIIATEKLASDTKISITMLEPGRFNVKFPSLGEVKLESVFKVGQRTNEQGALETVYLFEDPLLDKPRMVGEDELLKTINSLYLEKIMSNSVKQGIDYRGPNLNEEVLPDQSMNKLAVLIFQPRKIDSVVIKEEQAEIFRKLLMVLTSSSNNKRESGDYGDLLATGSRVGLLMLALENVQFAQKCYSFLKGHSWEQVKSLSVEQLCREIGVPKNSGNFER